MSTPSAEKGQDKERVAGPARGFLYLATLGQPALVFRLVAGVDGQRGQAVVAGEEQLRLPDCAGDVERFAIIPRALLVLATALVDLREDDERYRQVAALPQPAVHLHRRLGGLDALVVVAGDGAVTAGQRAEQPRLLELIADLLGQRQSLAAVLAGAHVID